MSGLVFSSLIFIFGYLPLVLAFYYLIPRKYRNGFLLAANLVFYGWGEPVFVWIMIVSTVSNYCFGLLIGRYRQEQAKAKLFAVLSIVTSLLTLGFFKYANFFLDLAAKIPWFASIDAPLIPLPIGISFYIFQTMSYTIDVYRRDVPAQRNLVTFGTYVSLFPQLIAGPIVRYKDVAEQLDSRRETLGQFADGILLFTVGLAKKVLLANQVGMLWNGLSTGQNGLLGSWAGLIAFALQIYFDFSGYSDMARGLGKMLGFEFMVNFNYPYISKSITEFWRRWHISLSTWFRDYVYIPLGGNRKGAARTVYHLLVVWFLTGFWHGANFNFILWGLYYFVLLVLEKLFLSRWLARIPAVFSHIYTLFFVLIGWALFSFEDFSQLGGYLISLFSLKNGLIQQAAGQQLLSYLPLTAIAVLACLPLAKTVWMRISNGRSLLLLKTALCFAALLLCTASLVSQSYNPFLYFRF